ncbi:MAG: hypothetical protein Q8P39_02945 [Candidatus Yanofskybacteria bacterium]|nr:hypothetical protein [Candidatus Yanofskybacteria bacterium]
MRNPILHHILFAAVGAAGLYAGFLFVQEQPYEAEASSSDNVSGYAWSSNIGWISFNCTDGDSCAESNYGVHVDPNTDRFSGYAWSSGIGWISFNRSETGAPPGQYSYSTHLAQIQQNGDVRGWARALAACDEIPCASSGPGSNSGGWDGWIKLRNHPSDSGPSYGVTYNINTGEFEGWAWGSDVVGWISFNCGNAGEDCEQSNYKVSSGGGSVSAAFHCEGSCEGFAGELKLINDSTPVAGPNRVKDSYWIINTIEHFPCDGVCDWTVSSPSAPGTYPAQLRVENQSGATDTSEVQDIRIKQDTHADFECSLDEQTWVACPTLSGVISQGELVYLRAVDAGNLSLPSEGASLTTYEWQLNGNIFANTASASTQIGSGSNVIRLEVQDSAGRQDAQSYTINPQFPFPFWREISPF